MADNPDAVQVPIDADQASLARLTQALTDAMSQGVQAGISQSVKQFQSMLKPIANIAGESGGDAGDLWYKQFADRISNLSDAMNKMLDGMAQAFGSETRDMLSGFSHLLQASQGHAERMLRDVETGATKRLRPDELSARRQAMQRVGTGVTNVQQTLATQTAAVARVYAAEVNAEASAQRIANREREQLAAEARGIVTRQHQLDMVQLREDSALKIEAQKRVSVNEAHALRYALQEQKQVGTLASVQAREASQIAVMERRKGVTLEIQAVRDAGRERAFAERSLLDDQKHQQHLAQQAAKSGYKQEAIVLKGEQDRITTGVRHAAKMQLEAMRDARTDRSHEVKLELSDRQTAARAQLQAEKQAGNLVAIEARAAADQATAAARFAGERRVAITKTVLKTIVMLERGIGKAIQGVARTLTSALGRIATGTKNLLVKTGSSIGGLLRRNNSDMDAGLGSALHRRTGMMRSSFSQEEGIVGRSVAKQKAKLEELNQRSSRGVLGALTGRGMGGGIAAIAGGLSVAQFMREGYQEAVNLNEQMNKNKVLFGEASKTIIDFANTSVKTFGATKAEALEAAGTFGNLFRGANFDEQQAANMSAYLVNLAGDLSSFNNVPINDVFDALRSGLVGEMEPLRRFGIMLNETTLKAAALDLGKVMDAKAPLDANAKAAAAFVEIFKQTSLAQGDFARTSKEGANAQRVMAKSFKQLAASLMSKVLPYTTIVINLMTKAFMGLNEIISNDTNPIIKTLRTVLVGAVAAIGGLLAIKGAIELFKVLSVTIRLSLSPLGMFITAAALVGGAIALMWKHSETLRKTIGVLVDKFKSIGSTVKSSAGSAFSFFGNILNNYVIPTIEKAGTWLANHLLPAFYAVVGFIRESVIPGFQRFLGFLSQHVLPIIRTIGSFLVNAFSGFVNFITTRVFPIIRSAGEYIMSGFRPAVEGVKNFINYLMPLIQPAIDGFKALAGAIIGLFAPIVETLGHGLHTEGFTGVLSEIGKRIGDIGKGIGAAFSGIVETVGNIIGAIGKALAPIAAKVLEWFGKIFSAGNIKRWLVGLLDFIETVGRLLGDIVSSPGFLKAVAAIAGVAVVIAVKFLKGFVEGVIANLPAVTDMLVGAFQTLFVAVLKKAFSFQGALIAILIAGLLPAIKRMVGVFTSAGGQSAGGFAKGFKQRLGSLRDPFNVRQVFAGFTGQAGTAGARAGAAMTKAATRELQGLNKQLRAMGKSAIPVNSLSINGLKDIRKYVADVSKEFTAAELKGRMFRESLNNLVTAAKGVGGGFKKALSGLGQIISGPLKVISNSTGMSMANTIAQSFTQGSAKIRMGFSNIMQSLRDYAAAEGTTVGKVLGKAVSTAAQGALSVIGGFMAGKAEGAAGGSGMFSALTSGLTAGLATGNPIIGVAAAGMSLLGTAIGSADAEAKKFKENVKNVASALESDLNKAVQNGIIDLANLRGGLVSFGQLLLQGDVGASVKEAVIGALSDKDIATLKAVGVTIDKDIIPALNKGDFSAEEFGKSFENNLIKSTISTDEFKKRFGSMSSDVAKNMKEILATDTDMGITSKLASLRSELQLLNSQVLTANDDSTQATLDAQIAEKERMITIWEAVDANSSYIKSIEDANKSIKDEAKAIYDGAKAAMNKAAVLTDLTEATDGAAKSSKTFYDRLADINTTDTGIRDLGKNIDFLDNMIKTLGEGASAAKGLLDDLFDFGGGDMQKTVDQAMIAVDGIGKQVAENLAEGTQVGASKARENLRTLGSNISAVIKAGVEQGTIVSPADAANITKGLFDAATAGLDPGSEAYAKIAWEYQTALNGVQPVIDAVKASQEGEKFAAQVKEYLAKHPMSTILEAEVAIKKFEVKKDLQGDAAGRAMLNKSNLNLSVQAEVKAPDTTQVHDAFQGAAEIGAAAFRTQWDKESPVTEDKVGTKMNAAGEAAAVGFKKGIETKTPGAVAAARELARKVEHAVNVQLIIRSPSRVFQNIGKMIGEGLRKGIEDSSQSVVDAAVQVVNNIVASVNGAISAGTATVSTLWAGLTGTDAAAPGGRGPNAAQTALGTVTTSFNSMLGSLAGSAQSLWDATAAGMGATAQQLDIRGESSVSLNATDVLGAQNLATISSYLNDIADYGETLLATGHPLSEVTATISNYVDQFTQTLVSMGFNADQVNTLVDQLGLSSDALEAFGQQVAEIGDIAANTTVPTVLPPVTMPASTSPRQAFTSMQTATTNVVNNATNQTTNETSTVKNVNIELHTPTGDPQATALAVANRLAFIM